MENYNLTVILKDLNLGKGCRPAETTSNGI